MLLTAGGIEFTCPLWLGHLSEECSSHTKQGNQKCRQINTAPCRISRDPASESVARRLESRDRNRGS